MLSDDTIELIQPILDIAEDVQQALSESYDLHQAYLPWAQPSPDLAWVRANLAQALANFEQQETEYRFFIRRRTDQRILGCIGLHIRDAAAGQYEIGYWARASEQGKGYISRGVKLLEYFATHALGAKQLRLKTAGSNAASQKVAHRCGYKLETIIEADRSLPSGQTDDTHVYCKTLPSKVC
jgi:RimJ/RimL family protein N-acetyltransferase